MNARLVSLALLIALLAGGLWAASGLRLGSDLARFMPAAESADQALIHRELSQGPGSRLLLLAIAADEAAMAARLSRQLRAALSADDRFTTVHNGDFDELAELQRLLPLRFSHSPAMDQAQFDADALADALSQRLHDLGSLDGEAFETLLAHDPHLLTLAMVQFWQPARQPALRDGVWFAGDGRALLLVQTRAGGFDPQAQAQALAQIREHFQALPGAHAAHLAISGPGSFSARMSERVRTEATWLGIIASVVMMLALFLAYRSLMPVLAAAVPLACAAAAGLLALRLGFDLAHGITLAFAFTLIGVALDYPVHLLSHHRPGVSARASARSLSPALRLSAASTAIAYLTLFSAQAEGLQQLAVFTIAGLLAAALASRWLLPPLLPAARRDVLASPRLRQLAHWLGHRPRSVWPVVPVLLLAGLALIAGQSRPWWNNDLASLTPLPADWLAEDHYLRGELTTPDARYLLVLGGADEESVLRLSETLAPRLQALVEAGRLSDHGLPSRYQPSAQVQAARLARLPAPARLRASLADAADATGFDPAFFEPMVADVAGLYRSDAGPALARAFADSPAGERYRAIMRNAAGTGAAGTEQGDAVFALVELAGLDNLAPIRAAIADQPQARLVDLKATAETMVERFRQRVLAGLAVATAALLLALSLLLGPRGMLRVLPPVLLGVVVTVAILRLAGVEMSLFHLIALMLGAGLGMDYAVFFNHADSADERARTLHAVLLSMASTVLVFGLLALSSIPVLRAIGSTVAIAAAAQFLLTLWLARPPAGPSAPTSAPT